MVVPSYGDALKLYSTPLCKETQQAYNNIRNLKLQFHTFHQLDSKLILEIYKTEDQNTLFYLFTDAVDGISCLIGWKNTEEEDLDNAERL